MICVRCGKEIADGSLICPLCDALQVKDNRKVCRHCGAIMDLKYNVCPVCRKAQDRFYDEEEDDVAQAGAVNSSSSDDYDEYYEDEGYDDYDSKKEENKRLFGLVFVILLGMLLSFILGINVGNGKLHELLNGTSSESVSAPSGGAETQEFWTEM